MKRTIVVTGAPYDDTRRQIDRHRDDTAFAQDLVHELGVDPGKIQLCSDSEREKIAIDPQS